MRRVIRSEVWKNENIPTLAQIYTDTGAALQTSEVASVALRVLDRGLDGTVHPETPIYSLASITTSTCVTSSFATSGWDLDAIGYNFRFTATSLDWAQEGGHVYRLHFTLSTSTYGPINVVHDCRVRSI